VSGAAGRAAPEDPAAIGRVVRPHGLAGEVVVEPRGHLDVEALPELWIADSWRRVRRARIDPKGRWVLALQGVDDRDAAEQLRGAEITIDAAALPAPEQDSYYIHELVGCRVEDGDGNQLGTVVAVLSGPQDVLEIESSGERSLVPMARDLLREIDIDERRIVIDAPAGLSEVTRS